MTETALTSSLPFYRAAPGCYIHRIRSGVVYRWDGDFSHIAMRLWCGMEGSITTGTSRPHHRRNRNGELFSDVPSGHVVCATCEGRAVGAGLLGAPIIAGHLVRFSPRI